mmetsp:Transcript_18333/g.27288  ORF Transcript_18333/g.27288 Transcript_18333/m.27288 type:complete len:930 (-) Transcript_18333:46-2835(-)|eukprot:CAMPEP_0201544786 /NCGR_PEP_ID=MMETSP0173_2-20130828/1410_1 /ASSEMBLY_ACC=CAM_ASM_000268 /TAXON_ID=218659 /ORGANISM="Vexillifera sp., Strain DIVA3 564/2" /LENGTH=929 /DNA_ID=CAMNT_0047953041 /DNA_START=66 /DNA_END=2855 /DNA_ORIENTATION=-
MYSSLYNSKTAWENDNTNHQPFWNVKRFSPQHYFRKALNAYQRCLDFLRYTDIFDEQHGFSQQSYSISKHGNFLLEFEVLKFLDECGMFADIVAPLTNMLCSTLPDSEKCAALSVLETSLPKLLFPSPSSGSTMLSPDWSPDMVITFDIVDKLINIPTHFVHRSATFETNLLDIISIYHRALLKGTQPAISRSNLTLIVEWLEEQLSTLNMGGSSLPARERPRYEHLVNAFSKLTPVSSDLDKVASTNSAPHIGMSSASNPTRFGSTDHMKTTDAVPEAGITRSRNRSSTVAEATPTTSDKTVQMKKLDLSTLSKPSVPPASLVQSARSTTENKQASIRSSAASAMLKGFRRKAKRSKSTSQDATSPGDTTNTSKQSSRRRRKSPSPRRKTNVMVKDDVAHEQKLSPRVRFHQKPASPEVGSVSFANSSPRVQQTNDTLNTAPQSDSPLLRQDSYPTHSSKNSNPSNAIGPPKSVQHRKLDFLLRYRSTPNQLSDRGIFQPWSENTLNPMVQWMSDDGAKLYALEVPVAKRKWVSSRKDLSFTIDDYQNDTPFFSKYIFPKEHTNYVAIDKNLGPLIISYETVSNTDDTASASADSDGSSSGSGVSASSSTASEKQSNVANDDDDSNGPAGTSRYHAVVLSAEKTERITIQGKIKRRRLIKASSTLSKCSTEPKFTKVKAKALSQRIADTEQSLDIVPRSQYKFGVLYTRGGQNEDEMFANNEPSSDFRDFLKILGEKVELHGFEGFRGGLDVRNKSTGTHSVYKKFRGIEIMFHVSTLLPYSKTDVQQLERKRHLGNDVVLLVFLDSPSDGSASSSSNSVPFSPEMIHSHFNYVFIVVSKVSGDNLQDSTGGTFYRVEVVKKADVEDFEPRLPSNPIFKKGSLFQNWLHTKLINAERAALRAPEFASKLSRTRANVLSSIVKDYVKEK